ncbi:hypothetical protein [Allorhodopirellula solitaria]|uniref:hypothetical protein n=1 Tax=Allorhodopirellula solitaria TaxID=2527987 RepID=UPI001647BECB|nr:hypothetical protein [Allorhodopirellula solitaria]
MYWNAQVRCLSHLKLRYIAPTAMRYWSLSPGDGAATRRDDHVDAIFHYRSD